MKRSGFKPKSDWKPLTRKTALKPGKPMARGTAKLKPVGARAKRMHQGKVKPTAEEQAWMDDISRCCVVCYMNGMGSRPAEVHHLKDGDRRMGHLFSIGLCYEHHRGGESDGSFISRHPWRKRFENAYGTEEQLLRIQLSIVATIRGTRSLERLRSLICEKK